MGKNTVLTDGNGSNLIQVVGMGTYVPASEYERTQRSFCAAVEFACEDIDGYGLAFLKRWNEGDFDAIREEWPEAPEDVFLAEVK